MHKFKNIRGFTLVEALIAVSIFAMTVIIASNILISIVRLERRADIENVLYEDVRIILQQLTTAIQSGAIDYEEYYAVCVIQGACRSGLAPNNNEAYYGIYHGIYGSRFYDPGKSLQQIDEPSYQQNNPRDLGVECTYPDPLGIGEDCQTIYTLSSDLNTGQNPFIGAGNHDDATAFFENGMGISATDNSVTIYDQLFLIDKTGTEKTIIGRKLVNEGKDDWAISKVVMEGVDLDQNGLVDLFSCRDEYKCYGGSTTAEAQDLVGRVKQPVDDGQSPQSVSFFSCEEASDGNCIRIPLKSNLNDAFVDGQAGVSGSHFIPITPLRTSITELKFIISPVEDPYKAFSEPEQRVQPTVTIIMTLDLAEEVKADFPGEFIPLTVQTTVSSGVLDVIETYPPVTDIRTGEAAGWIRSIIGVPTTFK